jgi:hypothetical protein
MPEFSWREIQVYQHLLQMLRPLENRHQILFRNHFIPFIHCPESQLTFATPFLTPPVVFISGVCSPEGVRISWLFWATKLPRFCQQKKVLLRSNSVSRENNSRLRHY